jgi:tetratricopeptide (TPR) repeat protein
VKKWELMREIAKRLADFQPDDIQWITSYAYATRRAESIPAAKEILLNAEPKFPKEAIIKYNLACYFSQMGDIQNAKNYLKNAFEIDLNWRMTALEDEDLRPPVGFSLVLKTGVIGISSLTISAKRVGVGGCVSAVRVTGCVANALMSSPLAAAARAQWFDALWSYRVRLSTTPA